MEQLERWGNLSERFSLIPLNGKVPVDPGWDRWCREKKEYDPQEFVGRNAGVACGPASGVIVLDSDNSRRLRELSKFNGWEIPETFTVRSRTAKFHYYYQYPVNGHVYGCAAYKEKGESIFDVRGVGGQVVAPGSIHPETGKPYEIVKDLPIAPCPHWLLDFCRKEPIRKTEAAKFGGRWTGDIEELPISQESRELILDGRDKGGRSEAIMTVCNSLVWAELSDSDIISIFEQYAIGDKYREKGRGREKWLLKHIDKARSWIGNDTCSQYDINDKHDTYDNHDTYDKARQYTTVARQLHDTSTTKHDTSTTEESTESKLNLWGAIKLFVDNASGKFNTLQLDRELNLRTRLEKQNRSKCLSELVLKGVLEKSKTVTGEYRRRIRDLQEMDIEGADTNDFPVVLPLDLSNILYINKKDILLVSGETNAGKTAFMFATMWMNIRNLQDRELIREKSSPVESGGIGIRFLSSEGHGPRVKQRLLAFEGDKYPMRDFLRYVACYYIQDGFHDMVDPDGFNCIDYIEVRDGEFAKIGEPITQIHHALDNGIALVGVQQRTGSGTPRGGDLCLEKPTVAIALSRNKQCNCHTATLLKVKVPKGKEQGGFGNCQGMEMDFIIRRGVHLVPVSGWDWPKNHTHRRQGADYSKWE